MKKMTDVIAHVFYRAGHELRMCMSLSDAASMCLLSRYAIESIERETLRSIANANASLNYNRENERKA